MNENKEKLKEKFSAWLWLNENRDKIKLGVKVGLACLAIGFINGVLIESKYHSETMKKMIDKITYEPETIELATYISDHVEELRPLFEGDREAYENLFN